MQADAVLPREAGVGLRGKCRRAHLRRFLGVALGLVAVSRPSWGVIAGVNSAWRGAIRIIASIECCKKTQLTNKSEFPNRYISYTRFAE